LALLAFDGNVRNFWRWHEPIVALGTVVACAEPWYTRTHIGYVKRVQGERAVGSGRLASFHAVAGGHVQVGLPLYLLA
jgi:hypothetical protein